MNEQAAGTLRWYAIQTHPKQEQRAESNLQAWKVETFAPKVYERRASAGRPAASKPLFPRYIFARFRASDLLNKIRYTRGVHSVVSLGGVATAVDDEIIALIKSRVGEDGVIHLGEKFKPGDEVKIVDGPLKGLVGVFEQETKDSERVMILLSTISYQPRTVVDRRLLERCGPAGDAAPAPRSANTFGLAAGVGRANSGARAFQAAC